ncbi:MAG: glycosyltransferase [Patescibacteria group bacterium]
MIAIITVHFGKEESILRLAESLAPHLSTGMRWYIVDNNEYTNAEHEAFVSRTPDAHHIHASYNGGFGAGNNEGVSRAKADGAEWCVFLNSDTAVGPTFRETLEKDLAGERGFVALPVVEDGKEITMGRIAYHKGMPLGLRDTGTLTEQRSYVHGAACALHVSMGDSLGWWDERFFLYWEDVALSWKARALGVSMRIGTTRVSHVGSVATKALQYDVLSALHARNYLLAEWAYGSKVCALTWGLYALMRSIVGAMAGNRFWRGVFHGIAAALRGEWGNMHAKRVHIGIEAESLEDPVGGVARMTHELVRELARRPELARSLVIHLYFKSHVVPGPWQESALFQCHITKPRWFPASFNIHYHMWMPLMAYWHGVRALYFPNYMLPYTWVRKSLVMLTPDVGYEMFGTSLPWKYRLAYRLFAGRAYQRATRVMTLSHDSARLLPSAFHRPTRDIVVVNHLAVEAPEAENLTQREPLFAWVGQAFERRHVREALEAFVRVASTHPNVSFTLAGADKYTPPYIAQKVEVLAQEGLHVTYTPHVSESALKELYARAHAIVYVSDAESFGLPPVEGAAHGAIPIVADTPLSHEIFGADAVYVSQPITVAGIEKAMVQSLTRRDDASFRGRIQARAKTYTWSSHTDRWLATIRDILS